MSINSLRFTMEQALQVAAKLGIDWDEVDYTPADFLVGMDIELEHGTVNPVTDVTGDDPVSTGNIGADNRACLCQPVSLTYVDTEALKKVAQVRAGWRATCKCNPDAIQACPLAHLHQ